MDSGAFEARSEESVSAAIHADDTIVMEMRGRKKQLSWLVKRLATCEGRLRQAFLR